MANSYFSVTIQTKPYLKKYLQTLYGEKLIFTTENLFGITIAAFLYRPLQFQHNKEILRLRTDKLNEKMEIQLPVTILTKGRLGFDILDQHILTVNKLFENRFEEDLWKFVLIKAINDVEIKEALELFCKTYQIELDEDITYECLKRKEFRYRKKMQLSSPQLSRDCFNKRHKYFKKTSPQVSPGNSSQNAA